VNFICENAARDLVAALYIVNVFGNPVAKREYAGVI